MSINVNFIISVTRDLSEISWTRNVGFWQQIVSALGLQETEVVGNRITYSYLEDQEISTYFSEEGLNFIEIPVLVFFDTEDLSEEEYEEKIQEFVEQYDQTVNIVSSILGIPEFDGNPEDSAFSDEDAIRLGVWSIQNAKYMINLNHQGLDVPITLCIYVEPTD